MIVLKDVTKKFGAVTVLDRVSLRIDPGEFLCLIGPSGAGKSTLLSLLVGAHDATSGTVMVDGVDLRAVPSGALQIFRRRVGVVFQDYKLLQNRTVEENIAFPLEVCGIGDADIAMRVRELLMRMKLAGRANALPRELSGGEKARTAIARAIVHKPLIVLADEPTGNLDPVQAKEVLALLQEINAEGATVVLATHDLNTVHALGARIVQLEQGKIVSETQGTTKPPVQRKAAATIEPTDEESVADHETSGESADGDTITLMDHKRKKHRAPPVKKGKKVRITSIHSE